MKNVPISLLAVAAVAIPLSACDTTQQTGQKQTVGVVAAIEERLIWSRFGF